MPIKMADSFSVTLVSNQNGDVFGNNTSYSFSNVLPRAMDFTNYEVAFQSIYYTDHFPVNVAVGPPAPEKKFFNLENKENEITLVVANAAELRARKETDVLSAFIDKLNVDLAFVRIPVVFTKTVTGETVTKVSFTYTPTPGYGLRFRGSLNRILGFDKTSFAAGTFSNDKSIDFTYFNSLANGVVGELVEFKEDKTQIEVDQLPEKPNLEVLLGFIEAALDKNLTKVRFIVDPIKSSVSYNVENIAKRIILSSFLNKYLGLPDAFAFYDKGSIRVPHHILYPSKIKPLPKSCSKLLVMCDVIKPQIFAGKEVPLLALLDRKHTHVATNFYFEPNSLVYKPTQIAKTDHITITIQSDNFAFIGSQENPTVINLHFKRNVR